MLNLFLDESGDHSLKIIDEQYPIFVLAGCLFEDKYYRNIVIPKVNELKHKYLKNTDIILRLYDVRKQKGSFRILTNPTIRSSFYKDLARLIRNLRFNIIAAVILKKGLKQIKHKLKKISSDPYEICFEFIMERVVMFAQRHKETVEMSFESRDDYSNAELFNLYERFKLNGSSQIKPSEIKKHILNISFPSKSANIIGHQIADLVAYPIARRTLNPDAENPFFNILISKFVRGKFNKIEGYGLKIFPKMRGPRIP